MAKEEAEAKLQDMEKRLQEGWNNLHAVKESHLEAVRNVVREQWDQQVAAEAKKRKQGQKQKQSKSRKQDRTRRLDHGQDQEHGH